MINKGQEKFQQVIQEISTNHHKIIDDWCKAYLAELYEAGIKIKPGCFTLNQMPFHKKNETGWKYWFSIDEGIKKMTDEESKKELFEELVKLREESEESLIEHPKHYQGNRFEVIDIIEDFKLNFHLGNAIKYILRAGHKDDRLTDLQKAIWYLQREVDNGS